MATRYGFSNQSSKRRVLDSGGHQAYHTNNLIDILNIWREISSIFWIVAAADDGLYVIHIGQKIPQTPSSNLAADDLGFFTNDYRLPLFYLLSTSFL